ncbi:hypothetical protein C5E06_13330 [Pseudoclavibacter sp. RFBI5]|uniref:hypothetical protein n=1 Tax=Pseudoclavibacter sp. RFBI5 TaxID=2080578 RepID=UPI000CE7F574|nr:hypothetical protein [Pseudoclavibacter sp. RFBI5]PPG03366.1 hypothetical protein C5E06_13330 [Pseudoclavibacter sp. RFBI5]
MKIQASIRASYDENRDLLERVQRQVEAILKPKIERTWHYEGRLKGIESYALKIETGKFEPHDLEDFFACTIVVPTLDHVQTAERLVMEFFNFSYRKPETNKVAVSRPLDFSFDHVRVIARLKVPPGLEESPVHRPRFEIQIKTYLQHAWSISTHDLTYKTSELSWGKERVAAQVKASLEAAEVAIFEAEKLAKTGNPLLTRQDAETTALQEIVTTLQQSFQEVHLPEDLKRLVTTVRQTLASCNIEHARLGDILSKGKSRHGGSHPLDLSPYGVIIQYLGEQHASKLRRALTRRDGSKIFVPQEVSLPAAFADMKLSNARFLRDQSSSQP